jgi:hypothetical protein
MGFFATFRKHRRVTKIARVLSAATFDVDSLMARPNPKQLAEEALLDECERDPDCKSIMDKHGVDREAVRDLYRRLQAGGAGQWVKGHFVSVSAIAWPRLLDRVLTERAIDARSLAFEAINAVERGSFHR